MELRHLRAFVEVANLGHFHRAAAALHLTQPALTQRIHALESELGVQLLVRNSRETHLTAAGEMLLPYAKTLIQVEDRALAEVKRHKNGHNGRIRVGYLFYSDLVTPSLVVGEFRRRHPGVEVETSAAATLSNIESVMAGALDVAFVVLPTDAPDEMELRPISRDHFVVAMPAQHELARLRSVPVAALRGERIVLFPASSNSGLSMSLRLFLARHTGEEPDVVAEEPTDQALQTVAGSSTLMTLVSERSSSSLPFPGIVYRRLSPSPTYHLGIAFLRDDPSPTLANLLRVVDGLPGYEPDDAEEDTEPLYVKRR
jgi:DNA-binding transcriptional LysR family regulator